MWRLWKICYVLIPSLCFGWTLPAFTNVFGWGSSIVATGTVREHTQVVSHYEGTNAVSIYTNEYWQFDDGATSNDYTETDGTTYTNLIVDVGVPDRTNTFQLRNRDVAMWELHVSEVERNPIATNQLGGYSGSVEMFLAYWHSDYISNLVSRKSWITDAGTAFLCTTNLDTNSTFITWIKAEDDATVPAWTVDDLVAYSSAPTNYLGYTPSWPSDRVTTNGYTISTTNSGIVTQGVWMVGVETNMIGTNGQVLTVISTNENIQEGFTGADYLNPEYARLMIDEMYLVKVDGDTKRSFVEGFFSNRCSSAFDPALLAFDSINDPYYYGLNNDIFSKMRTTAEDETTATSLSTNWAQIFGDGEAYGFSAQWVDIAVASTGEVYISSVTNQYTLTESIPEAAEHNLKVELSGIITAKISEVLAYCPEVTNCENSALSQSGAGTKYTWALSADNCLLTNSPIDIYTKYTDGGGGVTVSPIGHFNLGTNAHSFSNNYTHTDFTNICTVAGSVISGTEISFTNIYANPALDYDFSKFIAGTETATNVNFEHWSGDVSDNIRNAAVQFYNNYFIPQTWNGEEPFIVIEYQFEYGK